MTLSLFRKPTAARARKPNANRAQFVLEGLEERTVMSHMAAAPLAAAAQVHGHGHGHHGGGGGGGGGVVVAKHAQALHLAGFQINNVTMQGGQLMAQGVLSGNVKNHTFQIPASIPVTLTAAPAGTTPPTGAPTAQAASALSVLHLTLGPVNLHLLGLNVHLGQDCSFSSTKPIIADIVAIPQGSTYTSPINGVTYQGGLLGDVLTGVAGLLNGGTPLGGLTGTTLTGLESGLTQILNGLLAPVSGANGGSFGLNGGTPTPGAATPGSSPVLELPLGPISLDVLGALVQTSPICLNVTATKGPGNLLGNLLG